MDTFLQHNNIHIKQIFALGGFKAPCNTLQAHITFTFTFTGSIGCQEKSKGIKGTESRQSGAESSLLGWPRSQLRTTSFTDSKKV